VMLWPRNLSKNIDMDLASPGLFNDWRNESHAFREMAPATDAVYTMTGNGEPQNLIAWQLAANFLHVLGAQPFLGRGFTAADAQPGQNRVVLLSNRCWRERFGSDPGVVGRSVTLNDQPYTVIGVMPREFAFPSDVTEVWTPLVIPGELASSRTLSRLRVIARLRDGVDMRQAQLDMAQLSERLARRYPATDQGWDVKLQPVRERFEGDIRPPLLALTAAVGFLLLIVCANIANLLLVRAASRRREVAIRLALGASRARVVRQLLTENVVIALLGCVAGLAVALWETTLLVRMFPETIANLNIPVVHEIPVDRGVVAFSIVLAVVTGLLFGIVPALQVSSIAPTGELKEGDGRSSGGTAGHLRRMLVVAQMSLALVLLVCAGLMIKSFARLHDVPLGFNPDHVLTMQVSLPRTHYKTDSEQSHFVEDVLERMAGIPGVMAAGAVNFLPLSGFWNVVSFNPPGASPAPVAQWPEADYRIASNDYFRAMQIPILRGRGFASHDLAQGQPVCLINATMARRFYGGQDPVGTLLTLDPEAFGKAPRLIIGVAGDVKHFGAAEDTHPEIYLPFSQVGSSLIAFTVRTERAPVTLTSLMREAIWSVDKNQAISRVLTMEEAVSQSSALRRTGTAVFVFFASVALALAAVGIYGVLSYVVVQRRREIGIRIALGARRTDVVRMVLGQNLRVAVMGLCIGLALAAAATRYIGALLFQVRPFDSTVFAFVAVVLFVVSLAASWLPAARASRVQPVEALHE
jgi:predicted permease